MTNGLTYSGLLRVGEEVQIAREETAAVQRELAEVVRERDALIDLLRESLTVLDALKFHAFAFETRFHARQACPSYGDDDASQV